MTNNHQGLFTNCLIMFCTLFCTVLGFYPPAFSFIFSVSCSYWQKKKFCSCMSNLRMTIKLLYYCFQSLKTVTFVWHFSFCFFLWICNYSPSSLSVIILKAGFDFYVVCVLSQSTRFLRCIQSFIQTWLAAIADATKGNVSVQEGRTL